MATAINTASSPSMFAGRRPGKPRESRPFNVDQAMLQIGDIEAERQNHLQTWRSVVNLTQPDRQNFDEQQPGQPRAPQETYDSYPIRATQHGIGNIIGAMTPPEQSWCTIEPGSGIPEDRRGPITKGTEKITETVFDYLGRSRFATEAYSMAADLMVSTGFLVIDAGDVNSPFRVKAIPLSECYPVEGMDGEIRDVYRKYRCRVSHIKESWPAAKLSVRLERILKDKPREKVELVEATVYEPKRGYRFTVFDPADKYVLYDVEPTDPEEPSRWITPRLFRRPNENYGYGPGVVALPTIRTLNKLQEISLKAGARYYQPPILIDSMSGLNPHTVRLTPNSIGLVDGAALQGRAPFYSLPANGVPQWGDMKMLDMRRMIDDILFATEVVPPVSESRSMTAFEVSVRRQQLLIQQGVNLGRLQREFPFAVMRRCVWILAKMGIVPPIKVDGRAFAVRYLGPLAQAQDSEKASNILAFISQARAALGDQAATLGIKIEDAAAIAGEMWPGVPNSLLRDEAERDAMQKQAAELAVAQAGGQAPDLQQTALPGAGRAMV